MCCVLILIFFFFFFNFIRFVLQEALSFGSDETNTNTKAKKFALFSGHDTVIAPLLAALSAYDCKWPPYASHIAFELWSKPANGKQRSKKRRQRALLDEQGGGVDAEGTRILDAADSEKEEEEEEQAGHKEADGGAVRLEGQAEEDQPEEQSEEEEEEPAHAFVRVTFNGKPVTHRIKDCQDLSETEG